MCDFCDYIFDYKLLYGNFRGNSKNHQMQVKEREIFKKKGVGDNYLARNNYDKDAIDIIAETGDPFCMGWVQDVKYCPYCGRHLDGEEDSV